MMINGNGHVQADFELPKELGDAKNAAVTRFSEFRVSESLLSRIQDVGAVINGYLTYDKISEGDLADFKKAASDLSDLCAEFVKACGEIINADAFIISNIEQTACKIQAEVNLPADSDSTGKFHPNRSIFVGDDGDPRNVRVSLKDLWVLKMISQVFGPIKGSNIQSVRSGNTGDKGSEYYV